MSDTLKKAEGLGLAAVQVGETKRVFILNLAAVDITKTLRVYINPEIIQTSGEVEYEEGCLSFPGIYQKITRSEKVTVRAFDPDDQEFEHEADGIAARAIQHEFDHLEGKLFIDHLSTISRSLLKGRLKKLAAVS